MATHPKPDSESKSEPHIEPHIAERQGPGSPLHPGVPTDAGSTGVISSTGSAGKTSKINQPRVDHAGPADKGVHDGPGSEATSTTVSSPTGKRAPLTANENLAMGVRLTDDDLADNGYVMARKEINDAANREKYFIYSITDGTSGGQEVGHVIADAPYGNNYVKGGKYTAAVVSSYNGKPYVYGWAMTIDEVKALVISAKGNYVRVLGIARL